MKNKDFSRWGRATLLSAALVIANAGASMAQTGERTIEPDHDLDMFMPVPERESTQQVPRPGRIMTAGDPVLRAFPGSHFTPTQARALEAHGIRTVDDFLKHDAAVIGRLLDQSPRVVGQWQQDLRSNLR